MRKSARVLPTVLIAAAFTLGGTTMAAAQPNPPIPNPSIPPPHSVGKPPSPITELNMRPWCEGLHMGSPDITTDSGLRYCVGLLQQTLNLAGYPVDVDGRWGLATDAAVRILEKDNGAVVNGVLDDETIYLLGAVGDEKLAEENHLEESQKEKWGSKACEFMPPGGGPTCDDLMSPDPVG